MVNKNKTWALSIAPALPAGDERNEASQQPCEVGGTDRDRTPELLHCSAVPVLLLHKRGPRSYKTKALCPCSWPPAGAALAGTVTAVSCGAQGQGSELLGAGRTRNHTKIIRTTQETKSTGRPGTTSHVSQGAKAPRIPGVTDPEPSVAAASFSLVPGWEP